MVIGTILLWLLKGLLWLALGLLAVLVLALVAVLFVPVSFAGRLDAAVRPDEEALTGYTGSSRWQARLRWGLILFRLEVAGENSHLSAMRLSVLGYPLRRRVRKAPDAATGSGQGGGKTKRQRKSKPKRLPDWDLVRQYIREGAELLVRLWKALHLKAEGDITFGFDDPADTGLVLGLLWAALIPQLVRIHPDFLNPRFEGWLALSGRIWGYQVAAALWHAFWRLPIGPAWWLRFKQWFMWKPRAISGGNAS